MARSGDLVTPESPAMKAKLSVLASAGVLAGAGAVWLAAHQPPGRPTEPGPVLTLLVGASLLGCGLASWRARPENRVGKIMVFTGFAWFAALLVDASPPWLNTIGLAVQSVWIIGLVYLLLSFPSGRLPGRLDRWLVAGRGRRRGRPPAAGDAVRQQGGAALPGLFEQPPAGGPRQSAGAGLAGPPAPDRRPAHRRPSSRC